MKYCRILPFLVLALHMGVAFAHGGKGGRGSNSRRGVKRAPTEKARPSASSKRGRGRLACGKNVVVGSRYNLPVEWDPHTWSGELFFNHRAKGRSALNGAVNVQGSGVKSSGRIQRFTGKVEPLKCPQYFGGPTVTGKAQKCLIPMFSVAADLSLYSTDSIACLKKVDESGAAQPIDKEVSLPPYNIRVKHPWCFYIADTGSSKYIRGPGRFDFYSGADKIKNPENLFSPVGPDPEFRMDPNRCSALRYQVLNPDDPDYSVAKNAIDRAVHEGEMAALAYENLTGSTRRATAAR